MKTCTAILCLALGLVYGTCCSQKGNSASLSDSVILAEATALEFRIWNTRNPIAKETLLLEKADLYAQGGHYGPAYKEAMRLTGLKPYSTLSAENIFQIASYAFLANNYSTADGHLTFLLHKAGPDISFEYLALAALVKAGTDQWETSRHYLEKALEKRGEDSIAIAQLLNPVYNIKFKEPRKAKRLALFPGLGHVYSGYPWQGATSLALVTIGLGYAALSLTTGYPLTAILTGGGPAYLFFSGGRRYSQYLADKKNAQKKEDALTQIKKILFIYRTLN